MFLRNIENCIRNGFQDTGICCWKSKGNSILNAIYSFIKTTYFGYCFFSARNINCVIWTSASCSCLFFIYTKLFLNRGFLIAPYLWKTKKITQQFIKLTHSNLFPAIAIFKRGSYVIQLISKSLPKLFCLHSIAFNKIFGQLRMLFHKVNHVFLLFIVSMLPPITL